VWRALAPVAGWWPVPGRASTHVIAGGSCPVSTGNSRVFLPSPFCTLLRAPPAPIPAVSLLRPGPTLRALCSHGRSQLHHPTGSAQTAPIAQSMGGALALQAALAAPERITHLVLALTSGGVPMPEHRAADWRETFRIAHPRRRIGSPPPASTSPRIWVPSPFPPCSLGATPIRSARCGWGSV